MFHFAIINTFVAKFFLSLVIRYAADFDETENVFRLILDSILAWMNRNQGPKWLGMGESVDLVQRLYGALR